MLKNMESLHIIERGVSVIERDHTHMHKCLKTYRGHSN